MNVLLQVAAPFRNKKGKAIGLAEPLSNIARNRQVLSCMVCFAGSVVAAACGVKMRLGPLCSAFLRWFYFAT